MRTIIQKTIILSIFVFPLIFLSCRNPVEPVEYNVEQFSEESLVLGSHPSEDRYDLIQPKRLSLVTMEFVGHPDPNEQAKTSRFDVGVAGIDTGEKIECVILEPLLEQYTEYPWAPMEFSYNVVTEVKPDEVYGERDVFFTGDDNNRNGRKDPHHKTLIADPTRPELQFPESNRTPSWVTFYLTFKQGALSFDGMVKVVAKSTANGCTAEAYMCTDVRVKNGRHYCNRGKWNHRVGKLRLHVNLYGIFTGNHVKKIDTWVITEPEGYYLTLASLPD